MEAKEIVKEVHRRSQEIIKETRTLYEINDDEVRLMTNIVFNVTALGLTPKTTARLLKAAAHFIEAGDEMADDLAKKIRGKK